MDIQHRIMEVRIAPSPIPVLSPLSLDQVLQFLRSKRILPILESGHPALSLSFCFFVPGSFDEELEICDRPLTIPSQRPS
ncbi:MAG: hypothetical protein MUF49_11020 [Oculatellaceae cyanobacterium Prado106]|jgi:hypothetical protein|nr:hypothetical protein [Oculatellaceae cyanobacterium Prado106]